MLLKEKGLYGKNRSPKVFDLMKNERRKERMERKGAVAPEDVLQ